MGNRRKLSNLVIAGCGIPQRDSHHRHAVLCDRQKRPARSHGIGKTSRSPGPQQQNRTRTVPAVIMRKCAFDIDRRIITNTARIPMRTKVIVIENNGFIGSSNRREIAQRGIIGIQKTRRAKPSLPQNTLGVEQINTFTSVVAVTAATTTTSGAVTCTGSSCSFQRSVALGQRQSLANQLVGSNFNTVDHKYRRVRNLRLGHQTKENNLAVRSAVPISIERQNKVVALDGWGRRSSIKIQHRLLTAFQTLFDGLTSLGWGLQHN